MADPIGVVNSVPKWGVRMADDKKTEQTYYLGVNELTLLRDSLSALLLAIQPPA